MKKVILVLYILFMGFVFDNNILGDSIYNMYYKINENNKEIIINNSNLLEEKYHKEDISSILKEYKDYTVHNNDELVNIYYTAVNNGYENYTFYCDKNYLDCSKDINKLDNEDNDFSYINQLVNTYNSYNTIKSIYSSNLKVDISIEKKYTEDDIKRIDDEINRIINELGINNYENINDKIKLFHDYLARTIDYDKEKADNPNIENNSDTAIGALFEKKAICSGYTDALAIFLDKLNVENVKVANETHVWNAVNIDGNWRHIDVTFDDPVVLYGASLITHDYFMISTNELLLKDDNDHNFDENIYSFLK